MKDIKPKNIRSQNYDGTRCASPINIICEVNDIDKDEVEKAGWCLSEYNPDNK